MIDDVERQNFRTIALLACVLVGIACSQLLLLAANALELAWLDLPFEPITYIGISGVIAILLYMGLLPLSLAAKARHKWKLLLLGTIGFLPSGLAAFVAVAYVLEWRILFS